MDASIYRMRHQDVLALCVLALLGLGVVMVQSASLVVDAPRDVVHVKGEPETDHPLDYTLEGTVRKADGGYEVTDAAGQVHQLDAAAVSQVENRSDAAWQWSPRGTKHLTYAAFAVLT